MYKCIRVCRFFFIIIYLQTTLSPTLQLFTGVTCSTKNILNISSSIDIKWSTLPSAPLGKEFKFLIKASFIVFVDYTVVYKWYCYGTLIYALFVVMFTMYCGIHNIVLLCIRYFTIFIVHFHVQKCIVKVTVIIVMYTVYNVMHTVQYNVHCDRYCTV